jgi:hypothetical protein
MKPVLSWILAIVLGTSVFYVAYAHIASIATAKQYFEKPMVTTFASESDVRASFELRSDVKIGGGEAHVDGTPAQGSFTGFSTREMALTEGRLSMRFKANGAGPYEVVLGMEKTREGQEALRYVLRVDPSGSFFHWEGEELKTLPGLRLKGSPTELVDDKGKTPFPAEALGQWHDVELHVSTSLHRIAAFVDGVPTGSVFGEWIAGLPVRLEYGVRSEGEPVDVHFSKIAFEPRAGEVTSLDFTDRFDGKVIDPRHWAVHSLNSDLLSVALTPTKNGLATTGHATPLLAKATPAFMLDTPEFPLGRVEAKLVIDIRELHHALFFMGITSVLGGPHLRFFDVGIHEDEGKKAFNGTVSGHWGRDGQGRFDAPTKWTTDMPVTLEVEYDATTRQARAKMNGTVIGEHVSDLQMHEHVRVRFGAVLDDGSASFDVHVKELRLRATAD